jgi:2,3-bisphosphoglycerate-independent phosphoglycerate mutase
MRRPLALIILDGWGIRADCTGLPDGQMGNSEVGHMNLGAGRVVYQDLYASTNPSLNISWLICLPLPAPLPIAKENKKDVHLIGLLSDGGVHSHIEHLKALCTAAFDQGI